MNLNDQIVITLTENGVKLYKKYWDSWVKNSTYPGLEGNTLTIELWEFAQIFGREFTNGSNELPCNMEFQFVNQIKTKL